MMLVSIELAGPGDDLHNLNAPCAIACLRPMPRMKTP
jgi:hypothetical protein